MKKLPVALCSAALALSLAACGGGEAPKDSKASETSQQTSSASASASASTTATPSATPTQSATPKPTPTSKAQAGLMTLDFKYKDAKKSPRGHFATNDDSGMLIANGKSLETTAVMGLVAYVQAGMPCKSGTEVTPKNGAMLKISFSGMGGQQAQMEKALGTTTYVMKPANWSFETAEGKTTKNIVTSAATKCQGSTKPITLTALNTIQDETYNFDVPSASGYLVYTDPATGASWEWKSPFIMDVSKIKIPQ